MKRFFLNVIFFSLPLSIRIVEVILPLDTFTHRPWEALRYGSKKGVAFPFYPDRTLTMHAVGDLCHHTPYAVPKLENWHTDELGYRNDTFIQDPEVLFIGDSFIVGSGSPQDSTITNQFSAAAKLSTYSMAPAAMDEFITLLHRGILQKPKVLVYGIVERSIPEPLTYRSLNFKRSNANLGMIMKDMIGRFYLREYLKARSSEETGRGKQGTRSDMFFLKGTDQRYDHSKIDEIAETVSHYELVCDSMGIDFIFLSIPNKETVYYQLVPFPEQPTFITELNEALEQRGVVSVNALNALNAERDDRLLYHLDDTHWNSSGIAVVVKELLKVARERKMIASPAS